MHGSFDALQLTTFTGTAKWDDNTVQLLDDALKDKFGVTADFKCGHHRGHGVCNNKAKEQDVPCDDDACTYTHAWKQTSIYR